MIAATVEHTSVLREKAIELLDLRPDGLYVDCTVGLGGHSESILAELRGRGHLIGLDRDQEALDIARERLSANFRNFRLFHENFKNLPLVLRNLQIEHINGCLVDLGLSSHQLATPERGFSFRHDGPLDMRMDRRQRLTAENLINELSNDELAELFRRFGEEPHSRKIANSIVEQRRKERIHSTAELAKLVVTAKGWKPGLRTHPATQVFQALRIAVNQELDKLDRFLSHVISLLVPGGRLVAISFHSGEDRAVKKTFQLESGKCICFKPSELCSCPRIRKVINVTKKPVIPSREEVERNPRARSAKLRAVQKLPEENTKAERERLNGGSQSPED